MSTETKPTSEQVQELLAEALYRQAKGLADELTKSEKLKKDDGPPMAEDAPPAEPDGDEAEVPMAGGDEPPSHEELVAAFQAMDPDTLAVYQAAMAEATGGGDAPPDGSADMPVDDGGPAAGPDDAMKSELAKLYDRLEKSEKALMELKKSAPKASAPRPRAQVGADRVPAPPKSRELTKAEVNAKLDRLSKSAKTDSETRYLINSYYCNEASIKDIAHLLKD